MAARGERPERRVTDGVVAGVVAGAIGRCAGDRGLGRRCGPTDRAAALEVMCVVARAVWKPVLYAAGSPQVYS